MSSNPFALLDNEDAAPVTAGVQKEKKKVKAAAVKPALSGFPGEQPAGAKAKAKPAADKHSARVPDRQKDTHATPGGARGGRGGRGGARGGRGGRAGAEDGSVRQFDRRGAPQRHAPQHAQKGGAALGPEGGAAAPVVQGETVADAVEVPAAEVEAVEEVTDVVITEVAEDDDGTQTYEQYLAAKEALRVAEDAERSVRPVEIDESQFQKVKPLVREGDDEKAAAEAEAAERAAARKAAKKQRSDNIINLDEFRGGREGDAKYRPQSAVSRGAFEGAFRGGRGGAARGGAFATRGGGSFTARSADAAAAPAEGAAASAGRGGRGGFVSRGGFRGGRGGQAFAPRGGRGGFQKAAGAAVAINDKNAFPALA